METIIRAAKGGGSKAHTPTEVPDTAQSIATARVLLMIGNGEMENLSSDELPKRVYLDGTPVQNSDGSYNFPDVKLDYRPGTQFQEPIKGFPAVENSVSLDRELKYGDAAAWVQSFSNLELDAVRVRIGFPYMMKTEDDGDRVGTRLDYRIDIAVDGGGYRTIGRYVMQQKLTTLFERDHRIDLPAAASGWRIRVVRETPDSTSQADIKNMQISGYTEIIDAKLRYPLSALLFVEYNAKSFPQAPKISINLKGRKVLVPDNYDPETRTYSGDWSGSFKMAWTDNPAWCFYDMATNQLFGLGRRITPAMLDKWELYRIAKRCDQMVPDGQGGTEPRYKFDCYIQDRNDAWTVMKDMAAVFSGMTFWGAGILKVVSDAPADVAQVITRANVVNGEIEYGGGSAINRKSVAHVSYSDPGNHYQDNTTTVSIPELTSRYDWQPVEVTAIGCTRESEAQRRGRHILLTNLDDGTATFRIGLDGIQFMPGDVIAIADDRFSGRVMGGRVKQSISLTQFKVDRRTDAKTGDAVIVRTAAGAERHVIGSISRADDGDTFTFPSGDRLEYMPDAGAIFVIDSSDLAPQLFRVVGITMDEQENTFSVSCLQYTPSRYDTVDTGARIDNRPTTLIPIGNVASPGKPVITSFDRVYQGQRIASVRFAWAKANGAVSYEVQWRRDDNEWVNVPRMSQTAYEMSGVFAGSYVVRVRAIGAAELSSPWITSDPTMVKGRVGDVPAPLSLQGQGIQWGIKWSWAFAAGTGDLSHTELDVAVQLADGTWGEFSDLTTVSYPDKTYTQLGLGFGANIKIRARCVDKLGNQSGWVEAVGQVNDNMSDYIADVDEAIRQSPVFEELQKQVNEDLDQVRAEAEAQGKKVDELTTTVGGFDGRIQQISGTASDAYNTATSLQTTVQQAQQSADKANTSIATVQQTMTAQQSTIDGLNAQWGVKVQVATGVSGQQRTVAGLQLGATSTGQSMFLVNVGTFAIYDPNAKKSVTPFVVTGGVTYINSAMIANASIGSGQIAQQLNSTNWVNGTNGTYTGWMIDKNGSAYFNQLVARNAQIWGAINATSGTFKNGTFDNCTINANCVIKGKLTVGQIEGDVVEVYTSARQTGGTYAAINIPARAWARRVIVPSLTCVSFDQRSITINIKRNGSVWLSSVDSVPAGATPGVSVTIGGSYTLPANTAVSILLEAYSGGPGTFIVMTTK